MAKKSKKYEIQIIRQDLDGSVIKKTPASVGYQVWFRGEFLTFDCDLVRAKEFLDKMQLSYCEDISSRQVAS